MDLNELHRDQSRGELANRHSGGGRPLVGEPSMHQPRRGAEQQRHVTAERIGTLAGAAHHAAGDLEIEFPRTARYLHDTAAGFEHISSILRDPNLDDIAALIGKVARKQPAAIVASVVFVGLGLSWFLKNSHSDAALPATE